MNGIFPSDIHYHAESRILEVQFESGEHFKLSAEYLRVFSPSAEVRGHGLTEFVLVHNKEKVAIAGIDPVGQYAVRLRFDDGHDTGLYSWEVLYDLGNNFAQNWENYQSRIKAAGPQPVKATPIAAKKCSL